MFSVYLKTSYAYVLPPILGFVVLTGLALISVFKGRRKRTNILFAAICLMGALINADMALINIIADKRIAILIDRGTYFFFVFSPPIYIQFVHALLGLSTRKGLEWFAYGLSTVLLFLVPTHFFIRGFYEYSFGIIAQAGQVFHAFSLMAGFTVLYCIYTLFIGMKQTQNNQQKNRIKYILGGLGLSAFLLALNILPASGIDIYPIGNFSFIPAVVLGVGVLKYDLLDMGAVVRRGIVYLCLIIALTVLYFLFVAALNMLFIDMAWNHTILLPFLLALLMVSFFNPIKNRIVDFINRRFFRDTYDYREFLKQISGRLALLSQFDEIKKLLTESIATALEVTHVSLLVLDEETWTYRFYGAVGCGSAPPFVEISDDHPLVIYLNNIRNPLNESSVESLRITGREADDITAQFKCMGAVLIIPMIAGESLIGMIVLGQKKSGKLFVHEDMELLMTIANQSAIAIENAKKLPAVGAVKSGIGNKSGRTNC